MQAVRYADLRTAGRELAAAVEAHARELHAEVVLAIVRGGVPVGIEVATHLDLPFDVICLRAILQRPDGTLARAARVAGTLALDDDLVAPASGSGAAHAIRENLAILDMRETLCRGRRPAFPVQGKSVVVVDNGMRTGQTMLASIRALRQLGSGPLIAAVPVASTAGHAEVTKTADRTICLALPESFGNVGMFYRHFDVPDDAAVHGLLAER